MNRSRLFAILAGVVVIAALIFIFLGTGGPEQMEPGLGDPVAEDATSTAPAGTGDTPASTETPEAAEGEADDAITAND
ncbi:hypothetical protein [Rubellimicrobium roseum]|uniref:Uncharacterized protein n=1 Tax=Rubellimicrobium roseum TaxID=687525 RepID=A0A5C4NG65_9RHOB|nr:hypothetical protein [Rubellimicrobium roseum]TNC72950.1 hypothetical protein FHG71_06515 [Rubellimicrobium roseum]